MCLNFQEPRTASGGSDSSVPTPRSGGAKHPNVSRRRGRKPKCSILRRAAFPGTMESGVVRAKILKEGIQGHVKIQTNASDGAGFVGIGPDCEQCDGGGAARFRRRKRALRGLEGEWRGGACFKPVAPPGQRPPHQPTQYTPGQRASCESTQRAPGQRACARHASQYAPSRYTVGTPGFSAQCASGGSGSRTLSGGSPRWGSRGDTAFPFRRIWRTYRDAPFTPARRCRQCRASGAGQWDATFGGWSGGTALAARGRRSFWRRDQSPADFRARPYAGFPFPQARGSEPHSRQQAW